VVCTWEFVAVLDAFEQFAVVAEEAFDAALLQPAGSARPRPDEFFPTPIEPVNSSPLPAVAYRVFIDNEQAVLRAFTLSGMRFGTDGDIVVQGTMAVALGDMGGGQDGAARVPSPGNRRRAKPLAGRY